MTKAEAHAILNRCKDDNFLIPLGLTNAALERTGDICGVFGKSLCADGHESRLDRPCQTHDKTTNVGFSYSQYLDCGEVK